MAAKKRAPKRSPIRRRKKPPADAAPKANGVLDKADRHIRTIQGLVEAVHKPQPDLTAADQLAAESAKLEQAFGTIRRSAENLRASSQAGKRALAELRKASPKKRRAAVAAGAVDTEAAVTTLFGGRVPSPADATGDGPKLTDIFKLVADGLVDAQKALDQRSIDYVSQIVDPRIQPALFAIPSVKAAAKLALTVENGSNILVKLFGTPDDKTKYSESTLSFDIVAAPPPPDGYNPAPSFLVVGDERDRVIQKATGAKPDDNMRARATVFRIPQNQAKPYLLMLNAVVAGTPGQCFRLSLDAVDPPFNLPNDPNTLAMVADIAASLKQWEKTARGAKPGA
jgi:hypothetical protein